MYMILLLLLMVGIWLSGYWFRCVLTQKYLEQIKIEFVNYKESTKNLELMVEKFFKTQKPNDSNEPSN